MLGHFFHFFSVLSWTAVILHLKQKDLLFAKKVAN